MTSEPIPQIFWSGRYSSSEGSFFFSFFFASPFPCQVSALGSAGKLSGSFAVCRRKEPSAALQCSTRSLADPKRFSPLFLPLSIQSLRHGMRVCVCMCVYLLRQSRFRAPCTSPTESRLLRHKTQPPLSLLSLSPSTLLLLLPSPTWVANLFGYSYTHKKKGEQRGGGGCEEERLESRLWCPPAPFSGSSLWDKGARHAPSKEEFSSAWHIMYGNESLTASSLFCLLLLDTLYHDLEGNHTHALQILFY